MTTLTSEELVARATGSSDVTTSTDMSASMTTLADLPRHPLLFGPSPVHRLDRLTAELGGAAVWAQREDCNSGTAVGATKIRKPEYLVADALAKGADTPVSIGGVQSNHTRQVAARAGPRCVLGQESWVDRPDSG